MRYKNDKDPSTTSIKLVNIANRGIQLCRDGLWHKGLGYLLAVAEQKDRSLSLPGRYYSYLGYGIANFENRPMEGLALCKRAVKMEFYRPENYVNLAHTYLLLGSRRMAVRAIQQGLKIDVKHQDLLELQQEVGSRREPVLRFLGRVNPVNQLLGRLRYSLVRQH